MWFCCETALGRFIRARIVLDTLTFLTADYFGINAKFNGKLPIGSQ